MRKQLHDDKHDTDGQKHMRRGDPGEPALRPSRSATMPNPVTSAAAAKAVRDPVAQTLSQPIGKPAAT